MQPLPMIRHEAALAEALAQLVALDARLAHIALKVAPLPLRHAEPGFAALVRVIVSQQVSAKAPENIY